MRLLEESPADGEGIDILLELKGVDDKTKRRLFVKSEEALLAPFKKLPTHRKFAGSRAWFASPATKSSSTSRFHSAPRSA